ncbi:hypothetical protein SAMN05216389_101155 [Oceanobacillus limi]|uniref:Beta-carotene 15,15'-monooxygenase n=1 Tax=Oceanobacillus limi TaxID=930131 RepID=A0A1H9Y376_9BACI|nr:beta-carotene 15,15'-monooxygenase [Oceanobacillus limi]SES63104.1 hypothetical protein SAMN05216389_101155 [Oceanobacillus limi]
MVLRREYLRHGWLLFLFAVVGSNVMLYHTAFGAQIIPADASPLVIGSFIDLAIVAPILYITWSRKWNWKYIVITMAAGLILVRFLIPMQYLEPFAPITWVGFAVEGAILFVELLLIVTFVKYLPSVIQTVKHRQLPVIHSFHHAVAEKVKNHPVIRVVCSEMLVFYFALASWKKQPVWNDASFTLHRKSSYIALMVMLIHAIVLETIGLHIFIHEISPVISIMLMVMNIYTVLFFVGDIQAVRLNPAVITDEKLYISLGLMKRMEIDWPNVECVIDDPDALKNKRTKDTVSFIAKDLEEVHPTIILQLKQPTEVAFYMGFKWKCNRVAIRVDEPDRFNRLVGEMVAKNKN